MVFKYSIEYLKSMILSVCKRTLPKGISKKFKFLVSHIPQRRNSYNNFQIWGHMHPKPPKIPIVALHFCVFWGLSAVKTKPTPHLFVSNPRYIARGVY